MKHLVLIVGVYYPQPSPTGKCASQYLSLIKDKYKVDVVFIQFGQEKIYNVTKNNERLFGLSDWRLLLENWLLIRSDKTNNKFIKKIYSYAAQFMKAVGRIQSIIYFPNNLRWFYKKAFRELCKIHKNDPIDIVFTVNSPFAAHLAGEAFKKEFPEVKWVTYTVDPYYISFKGRKGEKSRSFVRALNAEKKTLSNADVNFLSEETFINSEMIYSEVKNRSNPLPYLIRPDFTGSVNIFDPSKINLVYAGSFYKKIRNPEYLFKVILYTKNEDIVLHLYSSSDCESLIEDYVKRSAGRIVRHKLVSSEEIQSILQSADVLINVGNSIPEFKPSKTFEYIATGRPIITFNQNNTTDETLLKYPFSLQINQNDEYEMSALKIDDFCQNSRHNKLDSVSIEKIYPSHSIVAITKILEDNLFKNKDDIE